MQTLKNVYILNNICSFVIQVLNKTITLLATIDPLSLNIANDINKPWPHSNLPFLSFPFYVPYAHPSLLSSKQQAHPRIKPSFAVDDVLQLVDDATPSTKAFKQAEHAVKPWSHIVTHMDLGKPSLVGHHDSSEPPADIVQVTVCVNQTESR